MLRGAKLLHAAFGESGACCVDHAESGHEPPDSGVRVAVALSPEDVGKGHHETRFRDALESERDGESQQGPA